MARRTIAQDDDVDEIFTNLNGDPDPLVSDEDGEQVLADLRTGASIHDKKPKGKDTEIDPDLLVEGEDGAAAPAAAATTTAPVTTQAQAVEQPKIQGVPIAEHILETKRLKLQNINVAAQHLETIAANANAAKTSATAVIESAKARFLKAKEAGESAAEIAAQEDILNARDAIRNADLKLQGIESERNNLRGQLIAIGYDIKTGQFAETAADKAQIAAAGGDQKPQAQAAAPRPSIHAAAFMKANSWMNDPKYAAQARVLIAMDNAMATEGGRDKDDPAWFDELTHRFNRAHPGLVKGLDGKLVATGSRQRGNGGAAVTPTAGAVRPASGANGVKFEKSDLALMSKFGFDPSNMDHRKNWLREKKAMKAQEQVEA